ncbi:Tctex-1 family-domain-containing protein [Catenaria anguillulae PL171]|uniref:Tctex-1 family-domain-containing protein n=1 Tax=Catenaria anguillulae PL171 TaxID=765915 RepID=A0A1Y2H988_9FUNG|nr:Tctex-1 family-domain-containing protein [Catenaria anguillulae PL171]
MSELTGSRTNLRGSNSNLQAASRPRTVNPNAGPGAVDAAGAGAGGMAASVEKAAEAGQRVFENTYKLGPDKKFPTEQVRRIAQEILDKRLFKVTYSPDKAAELSKAIAGDIIQALKGLQLERYKFVADVSIGEFKGQGIRNSSRALWDPHTDSFTSATFKNASLFCVAIVFGVYFE